MDLLVAAGGGNRPGAQAAEAAPDRHLSVKCLGVGCSRCGIVSSSSPGSRPAPFGWSAASPGCGRRGCGPARSSRSGGVLAGGASADVCCLVEDVVAEPAARVEDFDADDPAVFPVEGDEPVDAVGRGRPGGGAVRGGEPPQRRCCSTQPGRSRPHHPGLCGRAPASTPRTRAADLAGTSSTSSPSPARR
jgi:hypothetical protein